MKRKEVKREKLRPKGSDRWLAMSDLQRYKSEVETKQWRYCASCGKRFPERNMVWIDIQGWLCGECQLKNC